MGKEKELLRKQMELLAEQSKSAVDDELVRLSTAMCEVYRLLEAGSRKRWLQCSCALLSTMLIYLLIRILVHI